MTKHRLDLQYRWRNLYNTSDRQVPGISFSTFTINFYLKPAEHVKVNMPGSDRRPSSCSSGNCAHYWFPRSTKYKKEAN